MKPLHIALAIIVIGGSIAWYIMNEQRYANPTPTPTPTETNTQAIAVALTVNETEITAGERLEFMAFIEGIEEPLPEGIKMLMVDEEGTEIIPFNRNTRTLPYLWMMTTDPTMPWTHTLHAQVTLDGRVYESNKITVTVKENENAIPIDPL